MHLFAGTKYQENDDLRYGYERNVRGKSTITQDAKKLIYHITENDETVAFLPGFIIRKGPIKIFASPFEGWNTPYMGPLLRECVKVNNFLMSVRSRLKKDKFHYAQFTLSNIDQNLIRACGFQILEGNTYIARIADDPETVLSGYSKSTRKHVRRAINNGLAVEFTKDKSFIDIYYEQLCAIVNIKVIHWPSKTDPLALV